MKGGFFRSLRSKWKFLYFAWMMVVFLFAHFGELGMNWKLMILIWIAISIYVKVGRYFNEIPFSLKKLWLYSSYLYPLLESVIRFFIAKEIIPYSWRYFNSAEHFIWMIFLLIISYPIFYKVLKEIHKGHEFVYMFGFLMIVGIANELFEFIFRMNLEKTHQYLFAAYYKDTIYDLAINIPGAICGMILVKYFSKENSKKQDEK